jgi:hypothetical protein
LGSFRLCYRLPCELAHHTPTHTPRIALYLGDIINPTHLEAPPLKHRLLHATPVLIDHPRH